MKRVVRSTSVPIAERSQADEQVAFPVPGNGSVLDLGWTFADHHLGRDVRPCLLPRPGPWNPQRPSGAQARDQFALQGAAALDVEGLVDRLVADPHGLIIGEVDPEAVARSAPGSSPAPTGGPRGEACSCPSTPGPSGPTSSPVRRTDHAREPVLDVVRGAARWWPAWRPSVAEPAARRATGRSMPCTRAARSASTRCGAAPARSSTGSAPTAERSPAHRSPELAAARCPHVQRRTDSGPTPSEADTGSRRQRGGTTGTQPAMTRPPRPLRPRSSSRRAIAAQNLTRSSRHATVGRPGDGTCPRYSWTSRCRSRIVPIRHLHASRCCDVELVSLWVSEPMRGRGLGRALLTAAEDRARARGCHQVVLFTHAFQTPKLYLDSGYDVVGEVEDYPAGSAAYWFRKRLDTEPGAKLTRIPAATLWVGVGERRGDGLGRCLPGVATAEVRDTADVRNQVRACQRQGHVEVPRGDFGTPDRPTCARSEIDKPSSPSAARSCRSRRAAEEPPQGY